MIAAIYARFSSDLQDERSITDQIAACEREIERRGWQVGPIYTDKAMSAASMTTRPGLLRMMHDAGEQGFEVVVSEALDRLSRDQADTALIFKRLAFHEVQIVTLSEQEVTTMHVGLKGLMNHMFLEELARKTRRGLAGNIKASRSAGGRTFGYKAKGGGELAIDPAEAEIVREIHTRYAAGESVAKLVKELNARQIPTPRGDHWRISTISGQRKHGNGILNNELYIGRRIWNRRRKVTDPDTGKKRMRENPESEWHRESVPHLAILTEAQWQATKKTQGAFQHGGKKRRASRLLAGLVTCAKCGGNFTIISSNRYACANHRHGVCDENHTVKAERVEQRVMSALAKQLRDPALIEAAARAYHEERTKAEAAGVRERGRLSKTISELERRLERAIDQLLDTDAREARRRIEARITEMEKEKDAAQAALNAIPEPAANTVRLHPSSAARYGEMIAAIVATRLTSEETVQINHALKRLIDEVALTFDEAAEDRWQIEIKGDLAALMQGGETTFEVGAGGGFGQLRRFSEAWRFAA